MKAHLTLILYAVGAIIVAVGVSVLMGRYQDGQEAQARVEVMQPIAADTSATINEGVIEQTAQRAYALGVSKARDEFKQQQAEDKRNEPETANRADRVVPRSVRDNYTKRRLARERLGCVKGECPEPGKPANAPQR